MPPRAYPIGRVEGQARYAADPEFHITTKGADLQNVAAVAGVEDCNYNARDRVASIGLSSDEVSAIYPRPSTALLYRQNLSFVDRNPVLGQVFPGFDLEIPRL